MVIIIGGSSHTGKTLVAQKLIEQFKYECLSLDHLKMSLIRSNLCPVSVTDDFKMRYFLWPIASEFIKTAIENKQNLIVEGCYIPKEWKDSFSETYLKEIKCCFLVMSSDYINDNFHLIKEYANVIEHRICDNPNKERLIQCSIDFKNDCLENGTCFVEIKERFDINEILNSVNRLLN